MKTALRWSCVVVFVAICAMLLAFMHQFTVDATGARYIEWETAEIVSPGGTRRDVDVMAGQPELDSGEYIFLSLTLPNAREGTEYLVFEVTGAELVVRFDRIEIYRSSAPDGSYGLAQVLIPLPPGGGEELTMHLLTIGDMGVFPPLMRLSSDPYDVRNTTSYANYYALPAGATAVTFAILCGLFLLELSERRVQWKLLPLMLAVLGLTVYPISVGSGTYFLSQFWN